VRKKPTHEEDKTMNLIGGMAEMEARLADRHQTAGQVEAYRAVLKDHPDAVVVTCADERTGVRFGQAARRRGMCRKIGGARQPRWYQAWATWAPADLAAAKELGSHHETYTLDLNRKKDKKS
jgi:hypothetical protein